MLNSSRHPFSRHSADGLHPDGPSLDGCRRRFGRGLAGERSEMPPAAILDIDGTLVDTNYQHTVAWYRAFRQSGIVLPVWRIHRHIGMGGDQLVAALAGDEVEEELGDEIRSAEKALYMASIENVEPLEGARD